MLYIKNKIRKPEQFQFFIHQFVESVASRSVPLKKEYQSPFGKLTIRKWLSYFFSLISLNINRKDKVIVASSGNELLWQSYPYQQYQIIPMLWDVWPIFWPILKRDLLLLKCPCVFVTVRQMAEIISKEWGIPAFWIPEGIDINQYTKGQELKSRNIDVFELGRQYSPCHEAICNCIKKGVIKKYEGNTYSKDGHLQKLAFAKNEDLYNALSRSKIMISYPQNITNPEIAGNLETLTQRYWEGMLSGCLIVGHAPQELIDLIGYNPVVELKKGFEEDTIGKILENITIYQNLIEKNYETARKFASWDQRVDLIFKYLRKMNLYD